MSRPVVAQGHLVACGTALVSEGHLSPPEQEAYQVCVSSCDPSECPGTASLVHHFTPGSSMPGRLCSEVRCTASAARASSAPRCSSSPVRCASRCSLRMDSLCLIAAAASGAPPPASSLGGRLSAPPSRRRTSPPGRRILVPWHCVPRSFRVPLSAGQPPGESVAMPGGHSVCFRREVLHVLCDGTHICAPPKQLAQRFGIA